jgi:predicted nicotinamide N-methyase
LRLVLPPVTSPGTVGGTLWDSSLVLAKYLERQYHPDGLAGRRIIELGSGCGLVGIAAGTYHARPRP